MRSNNKCVALALYIPIYIYYNMSKIKVWTKINIVIYFENLTVGLHVYYVFNRHVKFRVNQMLFRI